jgi:hypothetical protein
VAVSVFTLKLALARKVFAILENLMPEHGTPGRLPNIAKEYGR